MNQEYRMRYGEDKEWAHPVTIPNTETLPNWEYAVWKVAYVLFVCENGGSSRMNRIEDYHPIHKFTLLGTGPLGEIRAHYRRMETTISIQDMRLVKEAGVDKEENKRRAKKALADKKEYEARQAAGHRQVAAGHAARQRIPVDGAANQGLPHPVGRAGWNGPWNEPVVGAFNAAALYDVAVNQFVRRDNE